METKIQIKKENQPIIYYHENKNTQYIFYARKMKMMKNKLSIYREKPCINLQMIHDPF